MQKPYFFLLSLSLIGLLAIAAVPKDLFIPHPTVKVVDVKMKLSEYGFFKGKLANLEPAEGVVPYTLNTPLFSDYAKKLRFVKIPKGKMVKYNDKQVFEFPVGSILIKNFYYDNDERKPEKGRRIMETRLLIHDEDGWTFLPYIWDEKQKDAYLEVAGGREEVTWIKKDGTKQKLLYSVPNINQCKSCHIKGDNTTPIGPSARQLNGTLSYADGEANQLAKWAELEMLAGLPGDLVIVPKGIVWDDPNSGSLEERARMWLDINCAHCHNEEGPANTSGLNLHVHETDPNKLGVMKVPIAAGRGTSDRLYGIVPGKPDESILLYRMESTDPGVMMPEVSRKLTHIEGVQLIREWIENMEQE